MRLHLEKDHIETTLYVDFDFTRDQRRELERAGFRHLPMTSKYAVRIIDQDQGARVLALLLKLYTN